MKHLLAIPLLVALAGALAAAEQGDALAQARRLHHERKYTETIEKAMGVARSPKEDRQRRAAAFALAAHTYVTIGCLDRAIATWQEALLALGDAPEFAAAAWHAIAQAHVQSGDYAQAASLLEKAVAELDLAKLPMARRAELLGLLASCRERLDQPLAALAAYQALAAFPDAQAAQKAPFLARAARLHAALHQFDQARQCLPPLEEQLEDAEVAQEAASAYEELMEKLAAAGHGEQLRTVCRKVIALFVSRDVSTAQAALRRLLRLAADDGEKLDLLGQLDDREIQVIAEDDILERLVVAAVRQERTADLVRACTRAMLAKPLDESSATDCLQALTKLRLREGRSDAALAAAAAIYAISGFGYPSSSRFTSSVEFVARALRARDGHLATGNAFRRYQVHGPAGPDGKPGTDDDIANPLADVAYKPEPEIDKLFQAALEAQPPTVDGHRKRAWIHLLAYRPKAALAELKRAFALCALDSSELAQAAQDIAIGLKALRATPVGMDDFAEFQKYGPNGRDGKPDTKDDLKDPLAGLEP
ncbi:MAG: hypothetical protein ACLF0G_11740 [Candidatus Brocadiia bacterium]